MDGSTCDTSPKHQRPRSFSPDTPGQRLEMFLALSGQFIESVDLFGPMPTIPRCAHESPEYRRHLWMTRFN